MGSPRAPGSSDSWSLTQPPDARKLHGRDRQELHRAVGGLVAIAGICAYDSDAQGLAQRYFHQALRLAKASGDRAFGGYVIALLVNQSLFLGEHRQAVAFAEAGLRTAGTAISHALACDLHAMQAKAYGRMGDQAGAHRCLALAEAAAWPHSPRRRAGRNRLCAARVAGDSDGGHPHAAR